jgi:uncharacterized membrane protein
MALRIISIIFYIVAGFFIFIVCFIGFGNLQPYHSKLAAMGILLVPAIIALSVGFIVRGLKAWRREGGITLLAAASFTAFMVFSLFCVYLSPEFNKYYPDAKTDIFNDYITGTVLIVLFAMIGILLIKWDKRIASGRPGEQQ